MVVYPSPEETPFDIHRERVAAHILTLFDAVDARVAGRIGYSGNIREELKGRAATPHAYDRNLNLEGLDPRVRDRIHANVFSFRHRQLKARYDINCQRGHFTPSVYVGMHDGFVEATLFLGPDRNKFEDAQFSRGFSDGRVRNIRTFAPNYLDPYSPAHPLIIEEGILPIPFTHLIYDNIDAAGNVTLLDDQPVGDPSGRFIGKYSAVDHTISPVTGKSFPYTREGDRLVIGNRAEQVTAPLQANIYDELSAITGIMRTIAPE